MDGIPKRIALTDLPDDAIVEILTCLPVRSLYRFRCVSKAWRDLIDDPLNRKKLPQTLEGFFFMDKVICGGGDDGGGSDVGRFDFISLVERSVPLDIDPTFSFLTELPEIEALSFLDTCNGLFLFTHGGKSHQNDVLGYIVCNPATKQWGAVPTCGCLPANSCERLVCLAFDPAVSYHFHVIQLWKEDLGVDEEAMLSIHAYYSETEAWSHRQIDEQQDQGQLEHWRHMGTQSGLETERAFVNGMLHLVVLHGRQRQMVAVDVQGKTQKIITVPAVANGRHWRSIPYFCQSQGRLHYISEEFDAHEQSYKLFIWFLQDYDTEEWVLKDTVSFLKLSGEKSYSHHVVSIHQDCNVIFFIHPLNFELMVYDMDREEVRVVASLEKTSRTIIIAPYIPYFSESPALTSKH